MSNNNNRIWLMDVTSTFSLILLFHRFYIFSTYNEIMFFKEVW